MSEPLTREDIKIALQEALVDLGPHLDPIIRPIANQEAYKVSRDKFERVLGIDCTSAEARKRGRTAMEAASELRDWKESEHFERTKKAVDWAHKTRTYFEETDEGKQRLADAKRVASLFDRTALGAGRIFIYAVVGGIAFFFGAGVLDPSVVKRILSFMNGH